MNVRQILSTGLAALPENANGVSLQCFASLRRRQSCADMVANVTAEGSGRVLATRLYNMTNDPGMKDIVSFLIARDTMHPQQWLTAIEDMGGLNAFLPVPTPSRVYQDVSYAFINCFVEGIEPARGRWRMDRRWTARESSPWSPVRRGGAAE
ncbi:manganese catalase family protein [Mesorhizobium sp. M1148]|uniref:manganese catalase family protein n=1 Tax=unclassified Mesorhizobium TaxID=325217 RepID=UPI0009DF4A8E|nr:MULTISPECIES: manganese catalase family protein [unclassified Mesorhizobium]